MKKAKSTYNGLNWDTTGKIAVEINGLDNMQDLNDIIAVLKAKQKALRNDLARTARSQFSVGDLVSVKAKGRILKGSIMEIKIKNATVKINDILYNVPLSIMEAA
jgi:DNA-binding protein YbaB